jgi:hypothetical protein
MPASTAARSAPRSEPKQLIHVRLPIGILAQIRAGHLNFASPARTADDYPAADYLRKGLE